MSWGYRHRDLDDSDDYDFDDDSSSSNSDKEYGEDFDFDVSHQYQNSDHGRSILTELASQRKNGELLDLVVEVDGRKFPCHRAVLASTPYFKTMLSSSLAESNSNVVQLHGIDSISFSKILHFLYTGEISISKGDVQDILQAAHMLQFNKIVQYCQDFIRNRVCSSNCLGVMRLADLYGLSGLKLKAKKKAVSRFYKIGQNDEFLSLSTEELLDLLTNENLKVTDEDSVVHSVIRWFDHDPESRKTAVSKIFEEIRLSCVRVSALRKLECHTLIQESPECLAKVMAAKEKHLAGTRQLISRVQEAEANPCSRRGMSDDLAIIVGGWKAVIRHRYLAKTITEPTPLQGMICVDPDIQQYYHITNLPTPVLGYMSATCAEGRLYVTGGRAHPLVGQGPHSAPSRQAFCYDFASDTWMPLPDMPRGRAEHQSIVVDGNLFLIGGDTEATSVLSMDRYLLDEEAWMQLSTPPTIDDSLILTVAALGSKVVLVAAMERTLDDPMGVEIGVGVMFRMRLGYRTERKLCVHAFDKKMEHWVKSETVVKHSLEDVDIFVTADHDKLYLCSYLGNMINIYVFSASEETLSKVEDKNVFTGSFFSTRKDYVVYGYRYAEMQKDIVDSIINYKFERNRREEERHEMALPFALFGHGFLGTRKSGVGWYCRDLEKLDNEDKEDKT